MISHRGHRAPIAARAATKDERIWQGNGGQGNKRRRKGMRVEARKLPGGPSASWVSTLSPSSPLPFPCHRFPCQPPPAFSLRKRRFRPCVVQRRSRQNKGTRRKIAAWRGSDPGSFGLSSLLFCQASSVFSPPYGGFSFPCPYSLVKVGRTAENEVRRECDRGQFPARPGSAPQGLEGLSPLGSTSCSFSRIA